MFFKDEIMSSKVSTKKRRLVSLATAILCCLSMAGFILTTPHISHAASSGITINSAKTYQRIDGFGASESFGEANIIHNLVTDKQQQVLSLLFSPSTGAGLSILRNYIGSSQSETIEPNSPGSPSATPTYHWDGSDNGQVWLTQQAQSYGLNQIYADAWSAPGFMKDNNSEANGGTLCGVPGVNCGSGDWRQAYANYLVQYLQFYQNAGIHINAVSFTNEPDYTASYSSMRFTPAQAADFLKVLGPTLHNSGLNTNIACCEATGWQVSQDYAHTVLSDPDAASNVDIITGHGYGSAPTSPITDAVNAGKTVWETEWSTLNNSWDTSWDGGQASSGLNWANNIHQALTAGNVNAFFHWWGAATPETVDNEQLILIQNGQYAVSKRLWAFANYSRFIRPGATRIDATTSDSNLLVTAFKNSDGTLAIVVLNTGNSDTTTSISLQQAGVADGTGVTPYLTNNNNDTSAQAQIITSNGTLTTTIPARSLETFSIPASTGNTPTPTATSTPTPTPTPTATPTPTPTPTSTPGAGGSCKVSYAVTNQWPGGFQGSITITNTGSTAITGWKLTFTFPAGQQITQAWDTIYTQQGGAVTMKNADYNSTISAGNSVNPGFLGNWNGSNPAPTSFSLNGSVCSMS